ncbi:MAG: hypothetical protein KKH61_07530 [Gammaproteobacteria bacterium]|nr:hypothetical protein [Gammaproteobacteria bacterium]
MDQELEARIGSELVAYAGSAIQEARGGILAGLLRSEAARDGCGQVAVTLRLDLETGPDGVSLSGQVRWRVELDDAEKIELDSVRWDPRQPELPGAGGE